MILRYRQPQLMFPFRLTAMICFLSAATCIQAQQNPSSVAVRQLTYDGMLIQRPGFSPDGSRVVFARHQQAAIQLMELTLLTGELQRITASNEPEYDAVYSPDGSRLLYSHDRTTPNQGNIDLHLFLLAERKSEPLIVDSGSLSHEEWGCWSPDGQRIAFTSTRDGNQELYIASADGKEQKRLTTDPAIDAHPAWSPDGQWIAFATSRWGDMEIAVMDVSESRLRRLTDSSGLDDYPAWHPNGRSIAFTSNRQGNLEICLVPAAGGRIRNLTRHPDIDNFPAWSPSGDLLFVSNRGDGFDLYLLPDPLTADPEFQ